MPKNSPAKPPVVVPSKAELDAEWKAKCKAAQQRLAEDPWFQAGAARDKRFEDARIEARGVWQKYEKELAPYLGKSLAPYGDDARRYNQLREHCSKAVREVYKRHGFRERPAIGKDAKNPAGTGGTGAENYPNDLIPVRQVLNRWIISRVTLYRYRKAGRLHGHRAPGAAKTVQFKYSKAELIGCFGQPKSP